MKRLTLALLLLLLLMKAAIAQEQLTIPQQADRLYERYEYFKALDLYLTLINKNKISTHIVEQIANCYRNLNRYDEAEKWYALAINNAGAQPVNHYYYAEALLRSQKFALAKQQYKLYFTNDPKVLQLKLAGCDSAAAWIKQPSHYTVKNAAAFNTLYSDWGLSFDGTASLLFTSDRIIDARHLDERTGNNWFKLYEDTISNNHIGPLMIAPGGKVKFTGEYHVGPIAVNATGDTAYITVTTELSPKKIGLDKRTSIRDQRLYTRRLQLLTAVKTNGQWVVYGEFLYDEAQHYSIGEAALSANGRLIYFVSDMPGGQGKTDIWYCQKDRYGVWGVPVNCGKTINTKEEDEFPQLYGDTTLYYASKGLLGMGGYDIYSAIGQKSRWTSPQNLKYPINTTSDDFYYVTRDGLNGYLSSNRQGGKGSDDIYAFNLRVDTVPKPVPPPPPVVVAEPSFIIKTIYYDLDKSFIRFDAALELDKLVQIMKEHPALKIELSSYCDSRASFTYNVGLSQRRAKAAVDYLVKRGIPRSRMVAQGYGKTNFVNVCATGVNCTEAEHQLNRRTEFRAVYSIN